MKRKRGRPKFGVKEKVERIDISAGELKIIREAYYRLDINATPRDVYEEAKQKYYMKCDSHARLVNELENFKKSFIESSISIRASVKNRPRKAVNYKDGSQSE